jgi:macrolide transport system ATP-binding/permease protein
VRLLDQDVVFARPDRSAREVYAAALGARADAVPLADLGLIAPRDAGRPVGQLSVGQRRRLALAVLVADAPQLLLLDEPTNHLSLTLVEELEEALRAAPGAIVAASHDRWLRRRWPGRQLALSSA